MLSKPSLFGTAVVAMACIVGGFAVNLDAGPLDRTPRVEKTLDAVVPNLYQVKITLTGGEVVTISKVALTEWSLRKRLVLNAVDKTVRVVPDGESKLKVIPTHTIEKIEIEKARKPEPQPVPAVK